MKADKLKRFIHENREEFEQDKPSPQAWYNIEKALNQPHTLPLTGKTIVFRIMKIAASVCLLLMCGAGAGVYLQNAKYGEAASIGNKEYRNEYIEATNYFSNQIDSKMNELQKYDQPNELMEELNQIDQISTELKMEILKNPDQDQDLLIKQMIRQYQQKLSTLNKILNKLEENNSTKSNQNQSKPISNDTLEL